MVVNLYDAFIKYFLFMAQDNFIYNFHSLLNTAEWLFNRWFEAAFFRKTMISVYSTLIGMAAVSGPTAGHLLT